MNNILHQFIQKLPKAELHVHVEGTMEPEQLLLFAERNKVALPYTTVEQARKAYTFFDYQSFIDAYIQATTVLHTEQDFYDLTLAYLKKAHQQGVIHTEIFFDLQTYMPRKLDPKIIINGIYQALYEGEKQFAISGTMIMCFIRHLSQEDAFKALELSLPYKDKIIGVGLASVEANNPPEKFKDVFAQARSYGYRTVAHAAEGGSEQVDQTLEILSVERIDHGIACIDNPRLIKKLRQYKIPLTVCPLSNLYLLPEQKNHPLKKMLNAGLMVTINSDDPAFFGGYIADNYDIAYTQLGLSQADLVTCARNSFISSFASDTRKQECLQILDTYTTNR